MRRRFGTLMIVFGALCAPPASEAQQPAPVNLLDAVPEKMPSVPVERMDGAQLASFQVSEHKARAAVMFRRETKVFENAIQQSNYTVVTLDGMIGSRGAIPLIEAGKLIGAIGCSGGTSSQDEAACDAGAGTVKK
jgi:uncharacterized protein GlcG (DUF336 family)